MEKNIKTVKMILYIYKMVQIIWSTEIYISRAAGTVQIVIFYLFFVSKRLISVMNVKIGENWSLRMKKLFLLARRIKLFNM